MSIPCKVQGGLVPVVLCALWGSLAAPLWAQEERGGRWEEARRAKAEQLEDERPGPVEGALIAVEQSIEGGTLGREVLGLKVYAWLLLLAALLAVSYAALWVRRRVQQARAAARAP